MGFAQGFSRLREVGGVVAGRVAELRGPVLPEPTVAQTVAARRRFFGDETVDPVTGEVRADRVVVSWFGCASYAVALGGAVILLDAWVPRGATSGYVPTTPAEVAALRPVAIFIGHGHFDHAADAGPIARASGAVVYGTAEHCATIRSGIEDGHHLRCVTVGSAAASPGDRYDLEVAPGVEVTAVRHLHSAPTPRDISLAGSPAVRPTPCPCDIRGYRPHPADAAHLLTHLADPEGGTLLYQFRTGTFTLTWHDSSGPLLDKAPGVLDVLRDLPASDLHLGAIQGFNQYTNGLRDPRSYIEALRPRVFAPSHHDNWLPLMTSRGTVYREPLEAELARIPEDRCPELRMLTDRADYLAPARLTFTV
ncbi:MBL fold metallo-hydrolase [Nocardia mexicana]|uniref:Metallo-beta-lactamase superfamily protein n=1 Tax=Nocardia mexicana TaxID=279262 RepID=A0A370H066_9NOCA|nr:MBL fold metallo-hydrolase [Nocardia mexicana]RDI49324.1 metallo-beta-lactamase superfamily protein [Nocardia mexicana]